jgi:hypothetical protein
MTANFEKSKETFTQIDELLQKIMRRAAKIKDDEIYGDADRCTALISKFATEIQIEMRQTGINSK